VALLYRRNSLTLLDSKARHIYEDTTVLATRDILLATFMDGEGELLAVLVNHHPSKYGGAEESDARRRMAVSTLNHLVDSLKRADVPRIVAIGDFNDTPDNDIYGILPMENLSMPLFQSGQGTIRYDGEWELIDQCFVSGIPASTLEILYIPFLMVPDKAHGGQKPLRTYSGPRYLGGVSDHCPILLTIL
jgi:endonuclease/exonuclease/phosphatase family metal-dependent hydrolase